MNQTTTQTPAHQRAMRNLETTLRRYAPLLRRAEAVREDGDRAGLETAIRAGREYEAATAPAYAAWHQAMEKEGR